MNVVKTIAFWLLIIGGLNMGLSAVGLDVIGLLGSTTVTIVGILVGLSAIIKIMPMKGGCGCGPSGHTCGIGMKSSDESSNEEAPAAPSEPQM